MCGPWSHCPSLPGLYACKEGRNSPCLVYVTFNQKIYVYWEVQLERMESTNLLKLLEAEPEFLDLLQELGTGESRGSCQQPGQPVASEPLNSPIVALRSRRPSCDACPTAPDPLPPRPVTAA